MRLLTISFSLLTLFIFSQILTAQNKFPHKLTLMQVLISRCSTDGATRLCFPTKDKVVLYEKKLINPTYLDYTPGSNRLEFINYGTPYSEDHDLLLGNRCFRIKVVDGFTLTLYLFLRDYRYKLIEKIQIHYYTLANNKVKRLN